MDFSGYGYSDGQHGRLYEFTDEDYYFYNLALIFRLQQYNLITNDDISEVEAWVKSLKEICFIEPKDLLDSPCPLCYVFMHKYDEEEEPPPSKLSCKKYGKCPAHLDGFCKQLLYHDSNAEFHICIGLVERQLKRIKNVKPGMVWLEGTNWNGCKRGQRYSRH